MNNNLQAPFLRSGSARFWITFLLASTVIAFRDPDWWVHPQFFAEDGTIFFGQQAVYGLNALIVPYAGYLHAIPRLIAWLASALPVFWQPLCYQIFAVSIAGACAAFFVLPECRFIIESDEMRMAISLLSVADCAGVEIFGNIASLTVFLFPVGLILLIDQREGIGRAIATSLIVLTSPGLVFFLPLSLWRLIRHRSLVAGSFLFCATIQLAVLLTSNIPAQHTSFPWWLPVVAMLEALAYRVIVSDLAGMTSVISMGSHHGLTFAAAILATTAALLMLLYRSTRWEPRQKAVWWSCLALGPVLIAEAFVVRREAMLPYFTNLGIFFYFSAARYFFTPTLLFLVLTGLLIEGIGRHWLQHTRALAMLLIFAVSTYRNYRVPQLEDLHWASEAARIEKWKRQRSGPLVVPINPKWAISLP